MALPASCRLGTLPALLAVALGAAPGLWFQYQEDVRSGLGEEQRKQRDQPEVLVLVMCAGLIFILSGNAAGWGTTGPSNRPPPG